MPTKKALAEISKYNSKIDSINVSIQSTEKIMNECNARNTRQFLSKSIEKLKNQLTKAQEKRDELIKFGISTREQTQLKDEVSTNFTRLETEKAINGFDSSYVGFSESFNSYVFANISSYGDYLKGVKRFVGLAGKQVLNEFKFLSEKEYNEAIQRNSGVIRERELMQLFEMKVKLSSNRTYEKGDKHKYYASDITYDCLPGLFVYSGFGTGNYYSSDGKIYSCSTSEASEMARLEQVEWRHIDSFNYYQSTYVGD